MPKLCSFGCSPSGVAMHRFPSFKKFPKSFIAWVNLVGGKLEQTTDYEHYQKKLICDIHFAVQDRTRNNRLSPLAIPSLFLSGQSVGEQDAKPRLSSTNTEQFADSILKEGQIHNRLSHISSPISGNSHYTAADVLKEHNYSTASRPRPIRKKLKKGPKLSMIYIFGQMKSYSRKLKHLNFVINRLKKRASFYKIRLEKYRNYLKTQHFIKLSEK